MSDFSIERITEVNDEVIEAAKRLAAQLNSSNQGEITPQYLERVVANPDHHWLMARNEEDARLVGMASLFIMAVPTNVRSSLENVVVDESARGRGVGHALHRRAFEIADAQGVNTLRTATWNQNTASKEMLADLGLRAETDLTYYEWDIQQGSRF